MDVGADLIGMVKTDTSRFCKETIKKLANDFPGGSYLMLRIKPMVPRGHILLAIGYKYNERKVIYVIVTENGGSTKSGLHY